MKAGKVAIPIGDKKNPITSLADFMRCISDMRITDKEESTFSLADFVLFRGAPADYFELVGRIHFDRFTLRDREKVKLNLGSNDLLEQDYIKSGTLYRDEIEKKLFASFKQRARFYQKIAPQNDWEWLALARHHGVPTRILDWSRDPQIALWFAVSDEPSHRDEDGVIFVFEPKDNFSIYDNSGVFQNLVKKNKYLKPDAGPFSIDAHKNIVLFKPPLLSERIDYQSSWFTAHPFISFYEGYKKLKTENSNKDSGDEKKYNVKRIYIAAKSKYKIRRELKLFGINEATVYKDLDHTGLYLRNKYFKMNDEYFTDESLRPQNIMRTFKRMQSAVGIYHSAEVESLKYTNMKGLYTKLITLLCDETEERRVVKFHTYNNMNRAFSPYTKHREVFLRLLEKGLSPQVKKPLDYKRIQVLIAKGNEVAKQIEIPYELVFRNFKCLTDGLSKSHAESCNRLSPGFVKYFIAAENSKYAICSFCLIELNNGTQYLGLEFNHDMLKELVDHTQNMCFLVKFKNKAEIKEEVKNLLDIYDEKKYTYKTLYDFFAELFSAVHEGKIPDKKNGRIISDNDIQRAISNTKPKLPENPNYLTIFLGEKKRNGDEKTIFVPIYESEDGLDEDSREDIVSHFLLARIAQQVKKNLSDKDAKKFKTLYGVGWYLTDRKNNNRLEFKDVLGKSESPFHDFYTFFGEIANRETSLLKGGKSYTFILIPS